MSEFTCRFGHLMSCMDKVCPECGERVCFMDGMSNAQLVKQERDVINRSNDIEDDEDG